MDKLWNIYIIEYYSVVIIKLERHQNYLEGLLTHRLLGLIPRASDSVSLGWSPVICISNKFPNDSDALDFETLENCCYTAMKIAVVKGISQSNLSNFLL